MRSLIIVWFLISSFFSASQIKWEGSYTIKFEAKKFKHSRTEIRIWKSSDSVLVKYKWSLNAYFKEKWMWENSGDIKEKGADVIELFVTGHRNSIPKMEAKLLAEIKKVAPLFIINQLNGVLYLEGQYKEEKEKGKLELERL
jgi:hypothetical protein